MLSMFMENLIHQVICGLRKCITKNFKTVYFYLAISSATRQSFLEFVSFYNEEDQLSEDLIEERWFRSGMKGMKDQIKITWRLVYIHYQ